MIRIAICEDVLPELERERHLVKAIMNNLSVNTEVSCFQSGEDLLCEIDTTGNRDIFFLDIEMSGMNGIETAKEIRQRDPRTILIFVSSYDQYCKELIGVQPFAFLDKPLSEKKLEKVLKYAVNIRFSVCESYSFSYQKMQYNIPLEEIRFFQSDKRVIHVNTSRKGTLIKEYLFYGKLEAVEETLNNTNVKFLRLRKSFLVNPQFIVEYAANKVVLDNGMVIEVSKNYKDTVRQYYVFTLKGRNREL